MELGEVTTLVSIYYKELLKREKKGKKEKENALTIPNDVAVCLYVGHAAHDTRGIIAKSQPRAIIASMA